MMIVLAILLGGFFGFALYKVGAANMDNLISMLSFQNLTLMKIIVFAIGLASVLLSIGSISLAFTKGFITRLRSNR